MSTTSALPRRRFASIVRPQDLAWLLFSAVLIAAEPETNYNFFILMTLIGAFQVAEPRLRLFASRQGHVLLIAIQLLFSYLLVGYTHGIESVYYPIFLIPVISAATLLELPGVILVTAIAGVAYPSFALFIDWSKEFLTPDAIRLIGLRVSFYAMVALLVFQQAKAKRDEMKRTQIAAEQLAESNRNLRAAEASLRRSERLAALGQLTAGLAHELRNPLGTIKASAEMLTKESTKARPEVMAEMAGYILSEADRVNGLISSFLDFARPLQVRPVTADLRAVIEDVLRQETGLARSHQVLLTSEMDDGPWTFPFDPDLLKIALSNLVQNAIQASAAGQTVTVSADSRGSVYRLAVQDHGGGIQPNHIENIFNPFFTTRSKGVGLGLAIVTKIIDEHQGRIQVRSDPGQATTFEISLPKSQ